ncbi:hypothetical protein LG651_03120 [Tamlana sp. 62-3]|uniref:Uncharacterized protein n=1 Tax=Neotamlana sargassicola TaxID=2883125 RepID=A0A9X1L6Z4_9FLAO|nr:hypothetical protein [Tamlana sargassicola]MCB4807228.1 hypothetical protein [Tamlana sargassicola]
MDLTGIFIIILLIISVPAIILSIIGLFLFKKKRKTAKILFIISVVYLIVSLGVCGGVIS